MRLLEKDVNLQRIRVCVSVRELVRYELLDVPLGRSLLYPLLSNLIPGHLCFWQLELELLKSVQNDVLLVLHRNRLLWTCI